MTTVAPPQLSIPKVFCETWEEYEARKAVEAAWAFNIWKLSNGTFNPPPRVMIMTPNGEPG